ncbi:MAG TPA: biopolymer transporter ExbD [Vicinamibacterales bacterium]|jgi:biopolymer transport protein TolR|nr:biopolymer transporter ExbD [Vicinamibacterales bacterium]
MPKVHNTGGGNGGARRGRGAFVATSLAEINVVPLVDVMLVLLIIFMVTAPMMQQGLEVNLPQARRADPVTAQPIYVTVPADFSKTRVVQIDKDLVRIDILHERVRQATLMRDDKSVFIRMDAGATGQDLFDVTDKLKEAGIEKVGLMAKPVERR